jgi:hypothetical protein
MEEDDLIKLRGAMEIAQLLDDIVDGRKYRDGIYKDDDKTIKPLIKSKDMEELMKVVDANTRHLDYLKKIISEKNLANEEQTSIINAKKEKAEEFFLKGSTNFIKGFDAPSFYKEENNLFFSVKVIEGEIDLAEITRERPGERPSIRVSGGVINDGLFVRVPIEIDYVIKAPIGTRYTVSLTSTNNQMKATFNYIYNG